jgi:hypothetical protein
VADTSAPVEAAVETAEAPKKKALRKGSVAEQEVQHQLWRP